MSKRRTVKFDRALEANVCKHADQKKVMTLFSPEQQKIIEELKTSVNAISEASRRIGIYGSKILLGINSSLIESRLLSRKALDCDVLRIRRKRSGDKPTALKNDYH